MRTCGDCQACCTALGISELKKPAGERCPKLYAHGCSIYPLRPQECRAYRCGWLRGWGLESDRPDRVGFLTSVVRERSGLTARFDTCGPVDLEARGRMLEQLEERAANAGHSLMVREAS